MSVSSGGAFVPANDYTVAGTWNFTGATNLSGSGSSFTSPTITTPTVTSPTVSGAQTVTGTYSQTNTLTAASYAPSVHQDEMFVQTTLTPATSVTAANGLNSIRGEMVLTAGKTLGSGAASYVTAVYGRVNFNTATVNIASGDLAAVYGKFDMGSTSTLTSGHIAPVQCNIVNPPASAATTGAVALFYGESASGTKINCGTEYYMAANFGLVFTDVNTSNYLPAISSTTLNGLNIKVQLNGTTYYIKTGTAA